MPRGMAHFGFSTQTGSLTFARSREANLQKQTAKGVVKCRVEHHPQRNAVVLSITTDQSAEEEHFAFSVEGLRGLLLAATAGLNSQTEEIDTVMVTGSSAVARPKGTVAIKLVTNLGPIAFEVNQHAIDALRKDLTAAETILRGPRGSA